MEAQDSFFCQFFTPHYEALSYRDMHHERKADIVNSYIIEGIHQAHHEANETQEDLGRRLQKTRVAVSDIERGKVLLKASDLNLLAAFYEKQSIISSKQGGRF